MTEREKMDSGDLYLPDDPDIVREQTAIGQGETTMSPLHSLLLVSALAKDGERF